MKKRLKAQILWQVCQYLMKERNSIFTRKSLIKDLKIEYQSLRYTLNSMLKKNLISIDQNKAKGGKVYQTIYRSKFAEIESFLRWNQIISNSKHSISNS